MLCAIIIGAWEVFNMGFLIIVLAFLAVFLWMFKRSVSAGHGRLLFWLAWFIGGLCLLLAVPPGLRPVAQVWMWVWILGMFGLPAWWVFHPKRRAAGGSS